MASTVPPFKIVKDEDSVDLRAHYREVAQHALRILWQRKWLIAASVVAGLVIAVIALSRMGPRYTSEALIQANLNPDTGTKSQPTVSINANEVVDSTARIIRSRSTADAVVARLGLDSDPRFQRRPLLSRWLSAAQSALGLQQTALTPRDLALDAFMRQVRVTAEPRSYLISVAVTAADPESAAKLANAVAVEYLRRQTLNELAEARSAVEHDLTDASWVYGPRHPTYLRAATRLEQLDARIAALRDASSTEDLSKLATGHSLIVAHKVMDPSGPNIPLILTLAILAGLSLGICLARYTPIGFVWPALAAGVQILLFGGYALFDSIFAIVTAGWAARRSALLVRLLEAIRRSARGVGELVAFNILASRISAPVLRITQIWQNFHHEAAPNAAPVINESSLREPPPAGAAPAGPPLPERRKAGRLLLRILLCLTIAGLASIPGDLVSSLGHQVVQCIVVFLDPWIDPLHDQVFAPMPRNTRPAADREPRAEKGMPPAASANAEIPTIIPAEETAPRTVPVQPPAPAATTPSMEASEEASEPKPSASIPAVPAETERIPATPSPGPGPSAADTATLVARGDALFGARDIASARLFYERAAEMGDGGAALRMGTTFDPAFLERAGIHGTKSDQQEALSWYRRARDLGDTEADRLLKTIKPH